MDGYLKMIKECKFYILFSKINSALCWVDHSVLNNNLIMLQRKSCIKSSIIVNNNIIKKFSLKIY